MWLRVGATEMFRVTDQQPSKSPNGLRIAHIATAGTTEPSTRRCLCRPSNVGKRARDSSRVQICANDRETSSFRIEPSLSTTARPTGVVRHAGLTNRAPT